MHEDEIPPKKVNRFRVFIGLFRVFTGLKLESKDYISIGFSMVAMLATLITLYKTYVEKNDDIAFIVDQLPEFKVSKGDGNQAVKIILRASHNMTFVKGLCLCFR